MNRGPMSRAIIIFVTLLLVLMSIKPILIPLNSKIEQVFSSSKIEQGPPIARLSRISIMCIGGYQYYKYRDGLAPVLKKHSDERIGFVKCSD